MIESQAFNQQFIDGEAPELTSTYIFYGQTPFLSEENAQILVKAAKQQGFSQREIFYIDNRTKFQPITDTLQSPGLFDPKKIIELRFDTEKPTKKIGEAVAKIAAHQSVNLVIIQAGNLPYRIQKEKWFTETSKVATAVMAKPIYPNQLANWIHQRATHTGITLESAALKLIMQYSEGNLLWTNQILMQLAHSDYPRPIQESVVENMLADLSVFHIEDLTSAVLAKKHHALKVIKKLQQENESLVYITTVLYREIETLQRIQQSNKSFAQACKDLRIWQSKQRSYQAAIQHYQLAQISVALTQLALLDKINKGQHKGDGWLLLTRLVADLVL